MRKLPVLIGLVSGLAIVPAMALAADTRDRLPSAEERTAIERVLRANGFVSWDDIELDDGRRWEVDDARLANGQQYDVKLAPNSLRVIRRSRDD